METIPRVADAVQRLIGVFTEIPGTRLTVADAVRLSGLDHMVCERVLIALEDARFLKRGQGGRYQQRATDSPSA